LKRISLNQFIAFVIGFLPIVIFAGISSSPSVIVSFLSLLLLGRWLLRNHEEARRFFLYAFLLNSLFAVLLALSFFLEHGDPFIGGGDDETFYEISRGFKDGLRVFDKKNAFSWSSLNYKAYIIVMAGWLKMLNIIGFSDDSFLNLNLVNSFFGALSVVLIFLIFKSIMGVELGKKTAYWVLLFPPVIFYSATIIRDTMVLFVFSLSLFILFVTNWRWRMKLPLLLVCLLVMYYVRDASSFLLAVFIITYIGLGLKGNNHKLLFIAGCFLAIIVALSTLLVAASTAPPAVQPLKTDFIKFLSYQIHYYNKEILHESLQTSLGARLRDFSNPVAVLTGILYMFFSPVPPLFFQSFTFGNLFLGLGNMVWYFIGFLYVFSVFQSSYSPVHRRVWWAVLMTLLLSLLMVYFSSGDSRHLHFIQPFIIGFTVEYFTRNKNSAILTTKILLVAGAALSMLYLILKFVTRS
jgi:hypothetical protein